MELGDLRSIFYLLSYMFFVAILAIMELGDLPHHRRPNRKIWRSRNPRYNGIGWFTVRIQLGALFHHCRNPRYNGIGWFTKLLYFRRF